MEDSILPLHPPLSLIYVAAGCRHDDMNSIYCNAKIDT